MDLDQLARRQHGLVTTRQLVALGLAHSTIRRRVAAGALERVRPGVYRLPGTAITQQQAWMAAVLAADADVVLSHGSAAVAWNLEGFPAPSAVDLLTTGIRPNGAGIRAHVTTSLPSHHRTTLHWIPVTSAERTFVDACGLVAVADLGRSVDDALRRKVVTLPRLVRTFRQVPRSGRRKARPMRAVLAARTCGFEPGASPKELHVMRILQRAGVMPLPQQNYRVVVDGTNHELDFAWPEVQIAMEYQSEEHHASVSALHSDRAKMRRLKRAGWDVWELTKETSEAEIVAIGLEAAAKASEPSAFAG